jgi:hypothetical protein
MFDGIKKALGFQDNPVVNAAIEKFKKNPSAPGMTPEEAEAFINEYGKMLFRIDVNDPDEFRRAYQTLTR